MSPASITSRARCPWMVPRVTWPQPGRPSACSHSHRLDPVAQLGLSTPPGLLIDPRNAWSSVRARVRRSGSRAAATRPACIWATRAWSPGCQHGVSLA